MKQLRSIVRGALPAVAALGLFATGQAAEAPLVLRPGAVLDVTTGALRRDHVVVIEAGRITAFGAAGRIPVPAGAREISLPEHTLLPGLVDTHTHLTSDPRVPRYQRLGISVPRAALTAAAHARRTLLAGFTTVRDVGAGGFADVALRDAIEAGQLPGPRMFVSGPSLGILGGHCDNNLLRPELNITSDGVADGLEGVRRGVRRNVKYGVDLIKYCGTGGVFSKGTKPGMQQYTQAEVEALIDEAHMHGRKVAVHAHGAEGIKVALRAGADSIEHASLIDAEGLELARRANVFLSMDIYNTDYTQTEGRRTGELEEFLRKDAEIGETQRENFRRAAQAGIRMTLGTDAGIFPHGDNARQLAIMVRYGMTPLQAVQAATLNGAELVGLKGQAGVVAVGAHADLIAVRGDPLGDVSLLERVEFVMKSGRVYKGLGTACEVAGSELGCDPGG